MQGKKMDFDDLMVGSRFFILVSLGNYKYNEFRYMYMFEFRDIYIFVVFCFIVFQINNIYFLYILFFYFNYFLRMKVVIENGVY